MNFKALVLAVSIFSANFAFGETASEGAQVDPGSIFHHQAAAGTWEAIARLQYIDKVAKLNSNSANTVLATTYTKGKASGFIEFIKAQYGIDDMWAVGLELSNGNLTVNPTPGGDNAFGGTTYVYNSWSQKGMLDPVLSLDGRLDHVGPGTLRFGLPIVLGLTKHKIDANLDSNLAAGGSAIHPYVAYEQTFGIASRLGVNLQMNYYVTDQKVENNSAIAAASGGKDIIRTGGNKTQVDVYFEQWLSPQFNIAADINYGTQTSTTSKVNGAKTSDDNGISGLGGGLYATYFATKNLFIVPVVGVYGTAPVPDQPHVKSASVAVYQVYVDYIF